MLEAFLATYAAVFVAEIVGDKLLYTSGVLATRFRWGAVVSGMSAAFMAKMAVAVAVGAAIGKLLPPWLVAVLTGVSFVGVAIAMWKHPDVRTPKGKDTRILRGATIAFATIFFSEWGDKGMTTAGVWAAALDRRARDAAVRALLCRSSSRRARHTLGTRSHGDHR
jgi:putative Ca2+/H+ antiporter (TMEM165/GDT1 family)